ncbi:hypothetical protein BpHYR1_007129 [Brachionus plicatilis]|uniref:Uncharacterized protein n=1 Tax=Brachionus plicatilis TaxID=10195 RepID=A0A3M7QF56_BRAPC|nr:hypothetical protein BpHYR1_007129 [Brachionus plicatilis]
MTAGKADGRDPARLIAEYQLLAVFILWLVVEVRSGSGGALPDRRHWRQALIAIIQPVYFLIQDVHEASSVYNGVNVALSHAAHRIQAGEAVFQKTVIQILQTNRN